MIPDEVYVIDKMVREEMACKPCPAGDTTSEIYTKNKRTNFDRITASPEALAEFMWNYTHDLITDWNRLNDPIFRAMPLKNILGDNCTKRDSWVEWLKQESDTE